MKTGHDFGVLGLLVLFESVAHSGLKAKARRLRRAAPRFDFRWGDDHPGTELTAMRETPKIMAHTRVLGKNRSQVPPPYGHWSYVRRDFSSSHVSATQHLIALLLT